MNLYDYFPQTESEFEKMAEQIGKDTDDFISTMEKQDFEKDIKPLFDVNVETLFADKE